VSIALEGRGNGAFEVDAGEVLDGETDGLFECVGCNFFQYAPVTGEWGHGGVEVVFVELIVIGEISGGGEQAALGGVFEGEIRTREEQPGNCLFQRPDFNAYPFILALGFQWKNIY